MCIDNLTRKVLLVYTCLSSISLNNVVISSTVLCLSANTDYLWTFFFFFFFFSPKIMHVCIDVFVKLPNDCWTKHTAD